MCEFTNEALHIEPVVILSLSQHNNPSPGINAFGGDINPANFTIAGWVLCLPCYAFTLLIFWFVGSMCITSNVFRYPLFFLAILVAAFAGLLAFHVGQGFLEKTLNIRIVKKANSERWYLMNSETFNKICITGGGLPLVALYLYLVIEPNANFFKVLVRALQWLGWV